MRKDREDSALEMLYSGSTTGGQFGHTFLPLAVHPGDDAGTSFVTGASVVSHKYLYNAFVVSSSNP
jgi:hypothetical protein